MNQPIDQNALTVTDVNRYIKALLQTDDLLSAVAVRGEISNFKAHGSGHLYFTLKDANAEIAAVMFRSDAMKMKFRPTDGMRVIVYGNVDVYEKSGRYQLYARTMVADGIGSMMLAYEALKNKLQGEGLFDPARKRPLPPYPRCVGVITALTGAAIRDILNVTGRRYPQAKILLYPSLVQGAEAPGMLCAGLACLNAMQACDVIILGRGGGSLEDLWAFNDEALVRAVAQSAIPVISAVGHETDFTLCDFAADCRAPTPSAAAELAVPDSRTIVERLLRSEEQLVQGAMRSVTAQRQRLQKSGQSLQLLAPQEKLARMRQQTAHRSDQLSRAVDGILAQTKLRVQALTDRLQVLHPLAVLQRGYSVVKDGEQQVVGSVQRVQVGQNIEILLKDGSIDAQVLSVHPNRKTRTRTKKEETE